MHPTIFQRIIEKANNDTTLLGLLGISTLDPEDPPCFRSQRLYPSRIPSVTFKEGNFNSTPFPGADFASDISNALVTTENPSMQVDVWVSSQGGISPDGLSYPQTGEDGDAIVDRLNILYVKDTKNRVQGTKSWQVISGTQQYEVDTGLFHNVVRYQFDYYIIQGFVPE